MKAYLLHHKGSTLAPGSFSPFLSQGYVSGKALPDKLTSFISQGVIIGWSCVE